MAVWATSMPKLCLQRDSSSTMLASLQLREGIEILQIKKRPLYYQSDKSIADTAADHFCTQIS